MKLSTRFAIVEMTRVKFFGLVVIAGILMWYFCPWLARLVSPNAECQCNANTEQICLDSCEFMEDDVCVCQGGCGCPACN